MKNQLISLLCEFFYFKLREFCKVLIKNKSMRRLKIKFKMDFSFSYNGLVVFEIILRDVLNNLICIILTIYLTSWTELALVVQSDVVAIIQFYKFSRSSFFVSKKIVLVTTSLTTVLMRHNASLIS